MNRIGRRFQVANSTRVARLLVFNGYKSLRSNISIKMVHPSSMRLWITMAVMPRSLISRRGFMGLLEANQEDRASNQRYWRTRLCWFGIIALCAVFSPLTLLPPSLFPCLSTLVLTTALSLETLCYPAAAKSNLWLWILRQGFSKWFGYTFSESHIVIHL